MKAHQFSQPFAHIHFRVTGMNGHDEVHVHISAVIGDPGLAENQGKSTTAPSSLKKAHVGQLGQIGDDALLVSLTPLETAVHLMIDSSYVALVTLDDGERNIVCVTTANEYQGVENQVRARMSGSGQSVPVKDVRSSKRLKFEPVPRRHGRKAPAASAA